MHQLGISGAAGRMGARLLDLASKNEQFKIAAAVDRADHPDLGTDAGLLAGVGNLNAPLSGKFPSKLDAVIDFSTPTGADAAIDYCLEHQVPLVMATTGLEQSTVDKLEQATASIPIVFAPSMSLAVNLSMKLVEMAGRALRDHATGVDVEIIERHHRFKADAPSGTAHKFGQIVADSMGKTEHRHGREGMVGQRPGSEIGYHAVRTGDNPGEHTIVFGMLGETIELNVAASNRDCYASGALAAAEFVVGQSPGMYTMFDVLGI